MIEVGTAREMISNPDGTKNSPPGTNIINDRNGNYLGRAGELEFFIKKPPLVF